MTSINWNPESRTVRQFGVVILIGFSMLGALVFWRCHRELAWSLWVAALVIGLWAVLLPKTALWPYRAWMGLGWALSQVTSRIVLFIIFYAIFSPVALVFRVMGRDALLLKKPRRSSYWVAHPEIRDPASYDHLF